MIEPVTSPQATAAVDLSVASTVRGHAVVFYDGACGLCDRVVAFALRRDRHQRLLFAPLQGASAASLLPPLLPGAAGAESLLSTVLVLTPEGRLLRRARAVAYLLRQLSLAWPIAGVLLAMIPVTLADGVYDWVARHRHRFFPKLECPLMTPGQRRRFLD